MPILCQISGMSASGASHPSALKIGWAVLDPSALKIEGVEPGVPQGGVTPGGYPPHSIGGGGLTPGGTRPFD